jgi:hypothetical protein
VAEVATFFKGGFPAQTSNNDNISANAARCAGSGAPSEVSEIVLHLLLRRSTGIAPALPAEFRERYQ